MMKNCIVLLMVIGLFSMTCNSQTKKTVGIKIPGAPILGQPELVTINGKPLTIGTGRGFGFTYAYPKLHDFNNDGKLDLLVGQFIPSPKIRLFINKGSKSNAKFSDEGFVKDVDGNDLTIKTN